jgi:hypothetical protein
VTATYELQTNALITLPEARRFVWRQEEDTSRDGQLVDAINDVSDAIADHCQREFATTTASPRAGADGVGNGTTTFTAATGAFTTADEGAKIYIDGTLYEIVTRNSGTSVTLDAAVPTGTDLSWDFGETRVFEYDGSGTLDLRPYDLRELHAVTLYTDLQASLQDVLTADEYRLRPAGRALGGTYLTLGLPTPSVEEEDYGFGWEASVTGQWGMATVPGAVKLAAKQWVKNIVENPGSYTAYAMNGYNVVPDFGVPGAGMPRAVERRLERWRRGSNDGAMTVVRFRHPNEGQPGVPYAGLPRAN